MVRISLVPFDGTKKADWFMSDISCVINAWITMITLAVILAAIATLTGVNLFHLFSKVISTSEAQLGIGWSSIFITFATFVPPFVLVFIFRKNYMVMGTKRQFRYLCRWL